MASSSVSQESLDRDDYEINARRRINRTLRSGRGVPHKPEHHESFDSYSSHYDHLEGEPHRVGQDVLAEHESPTRMANRMKDKRGRPNHLHKGKPLKDKRKLREKRRSTGVVHLPSTESTGDSLDDDDMVMEAKRNTTQEVIDADNPQTPEEERNMKSFSPRAVHIRNKSPSDLEADLEDNQDYDSTVSQSETNLTLIGQTPALPQTAHHHHHHHHHQRSRPSYEGSRILASHAENRVTFQPRSAYRDSDSTADSNHAFGTSPGNSSHPVNRVTRLPVRETAPQLVNGLNQQTSHAAAGGYSNLEKELQQEREEKQKLQVMVSERDQKIAQLEREIRALKQLSQR